MKGIYDQDGLRSIHNHEFMNEERFIRAYERGVKAAGKDYNWHWRVHIGLWASRVASNLKGDYVECGVNAGFLSSAIMCDLDWNNQNKCFYLLDTFSGLNPAQVTEGEKIDGILTKNRALIEAGFYVTSAEQVQRNFSEWDNVIIIEGAIPETLDQIDTDDIAFLHIDLNCASPEVDSLSFLWNKLVSGAIVLLDDYAYSGYHHQKYAMDEFAKNNYFSIVSLPSGQGMIIKP